MAKRTAAVPDNQAPEQAADDCIRAIADNERLRQILTVLPQLVFQSDRDGRLISWNKGTLDISGYTDDDLRSGLKLSDFVHPDDRLRAIENIARVMAGESHHGTEYRLLRKNGAVIPMALYVQPLRQGEEIIGMTGVAVDLREFKRLENETLRLSSFPEQNPQPVVELDSDWKVTYVNPVAKERFPDLAASGLSHPFLVGLEDFVRELPVGGQVTREIEVGTAWYLQAVIKTQKPECLRVFASDITELKRITRELTDKEKLYRAFIENSPDIVFVMDQHGRLTYVSPQCRRLGVAAEEIVGRTFAETGLVEPSDMRRLMPMFEKHLETGEAMRVEMRVIDRSGNTHWFEEADQIQRDNGEITGLVGVLHDITERKRVEESLADSESRYRAIVESTDDTVVMVNAIGRITYLSPQVAKFGFGAEDIGRDFLEIIHEEDREHVKDEFRETMATGDEHPMRMRVVNSKGQIYWVEELGRVQRDDLGRPAGVISTLRDVTDRKRVEDALIASEHRFRQLTENVYDIIFSADQHGKIDYVSPQISHLGLEAGQVTGHLLSDYVAQDNDEDVWQEIREALSSGKPANHPITIKFRRADGNHFWVEAAVKQRLDDNGRPNGFIGSLRDVTERIHAEAALAESQKRYASLIENLPIGVYRRTPGPQGRFIEINDAMAIIFEADSRGAMAAHPVIDLYADADDLPPFEKTLREQGVVRNRVMHFKTFKGRQIWCAVTAVYKKDNDNEYFDCIMEDITERRQGELQLAEERLRNETLLADMTIGVFRCSIGPSARFEYANPALTRILEADSLEQLYGVTLQSLRSGDGNWDKFLTRVDQVGSIRDEDAKLKTLKGREIWVSATVGRKTDEAGHVYLDGLIQDVTASRLSEEKLREADRLRVKMFRFMAHQMRTPLMSVNWNLQTLLEGQVGALQPAQKEFLRVIRDEFDNIMGNLDEMLIAVDIQQNRITLNREDFSLDSIWSAVQRSMEARYSAKKLDVTVDTPAAGLPVVYADPEKIKYVMSTLFENAMDYSQPAGKISVTLSARPGVVRCEVIDHGIGIPANEQYRIGEVFYRATNAPLMKPDSSGLGIHIAKHFVEKHGGSFGFTSHESEGSSFWFELPLVKPAAAAAYRS